MPTTEQQLAAARAMRAALENWNVVIQDWRNSGKQPDYRALIAAQDSGHAAIAAAKAAGL
jgi:hypothetical protein